MDLKQVIENLKKAATGSRNLDAQIGLAMGLTRTREAFMDDKGNAQIRSLFSDPISGKPMNVPPYTSSISAAKDLYDTCAPGLPAAVAWKDGKSEAVAEGFKTSTGITTPIALCILALVVKRGDQNDRHASDDYEGLE